VREWFPRRAGFHALTQETPALGWIRKKFHAGDEPMPLLTTASQFKDPDAAYVALIEARRGLSESDAAALDARLVLILANHIGDLDVLTEAITLAKAGR
jgi:hypothetical protein